MEYIIEWGWTEQQFMDAVNKKISEGWIPQGGVAVGVNADDGNGWYQAMIRNK
jgi:hypothetical protein